MTFAHLHASLHQQALGIRQEGALNDTDIRLMFSLNPPRSIALADLKAPKGGAERGPEPIGEDRVPVIRRLRSPLYIGSVGNACTLGSCNGIICIRVRGDFVLWNPSTGEHNVLPKSNRIVSSLYCPEQYYGFGYDHVNDDYKVVVGQCDLHKRNYVIEPRVHVFSLLRGTWNTYLGPRKSRMKQKAACVNGVLHWLRFRDWREFYSKEVICFSLAEERFTEVMPLLVRFSGTFVSRDRLCLYHEGPHFRILMMKEYGVKESWSEVLYIARHNILEIFNDTRLVEPLWILENGDVLAWALQRESHFSPCLSIYKSKDKEFENFIKIRADYTFENITYRETLVSPLTGSLKEH